MVYEQECCLEAGEHTVYCRDSYGDGWHGGYLEINGDKFCDTFDSGTGTEETVTIKAAGKNSNLMMIPKFSNCTNLMS